MDYDDTFSRVFPGLKRNGYGTILIDVPQRFKTFDNRTNVAARATENSPEKVHYSTMSHEEIQALPIPDLLAKDAAVLSWTSPTFLQIAIGTLKGWGLAYKTVGFVWIKADPNVTPILPRMGMGFWTRANAEFCLLATKGNPKRLHADVRQVIIEPRREHSRKPDIYDRIERLLPGPYLELFARQTRPGWESWGDQINHFEASRL